MLIGSAWSIFASVFFGLYAGFTERLMVEDLTNAGPGDFLLEGFWLAASIAVFITGIYTLRNRQCPEKLITIHEKTKIAFLLMVFGLAPSR